MSSLIIFLPCRGGGILHIKIKFRIKTRFYPIKAHEMFRKSGKKQGRLNSDLQFGLHKLN